MEYSAGSDTASQIVRMMIVNWCAVISQSQFNRQRPARRCVAM
jgi:hypothetical protein